MQALLTRLAQTPAGSRQLMAANCIGYLAQCRFIDLQPDYHGDHFPPGSHGNLLNPSGGGFVPTIGDRYRQLLVPLLKLLLTMLTCPGAQRSEVKSQVRPHRHHLTFDLTVVFFFPKGDLSNWCPLRYLYLHPQESSECCFHGSTGGAVISNGGHKSLRGRSGLE